MLIFALTRCSSPASWSAAHPEYLGKKIQAAEMKLVVLYILLVPLVILDVRGHLDRAEDRAELAWRTPDRTA